MKVLLPGNQEQDILRVETTRLNLELPINFGDIRSPKPLSDGRLWHIYGLLHGERNEIFHISANEISGSWRMAEKIKLHNFSTPNISTKTTNMSAPGIIYDHPNDVYHMYIHTHYSDLGGLIQHFVSEDSVNFEFHDTVHLTSEEKSASSSYDPYPLLLDGQKYITYTAYNHSKAGMIYLADSKTGSWNGPWQNRGTLIPLREMLNFTPQEHNSIWMLSNSQVIQLTNDLFLLFATRTLQGRSHLFAAYSAIAKGPYKIMGSLLNPAPTNWDGGDISHGGAVIIGDKLNLFYSAKSQHTEQKWRYGLAQFELEDLVNYLSPVTSGKS